MSRKRVRAGILALAVAGLSPLGSGVARADATWTGSTSQDWNVAGNWNSGPAGNVSINTETGNYPVLDADSGSAFIPGYVYIGGGTGNSGRFDQTKGSLSLANLAVNAPADWFLVASSGGTGAYNLTGSGSLTVGKLFAGGAWANDNGTGTITINTSGTVTATSTHDSSGNADGTGGWGGGNASVAIGWGGSGKGTLNLISGDLHASGETRVGTFWGNGIVNQSGGRIITDQLRVGAWGATGTMNQSGGSMTAGTLVVGSGAGWAGAGTGTYNVTGSGGFTVGKVFVGGGWDNDNGTGTLTVDTTGTVVATSTDDPSGWGGNAASIAVGWGGNGGNGTLNVKSGTLTSSGQLWVGVFGGTGTVNHTGGVINTTDLKVVKNSGTGTVNVTNATVNASGSVSLANSSDGSSVTKATLNVNSGGIVNSENDLVVAVGGDGSKGSFGQVNIAEGGTVNVGTTTQRTLFVNQYDTVNGELNVNGGTVNLNAGTGITFNAGWATASTGTVNLNSGAITSTGAGVVDLNPVWSGGATSTFNLNGGTLTVAQVKASTPTNTAVFNFNGGTLKPAGDNNSFVDLLNWNGTHRVNVRNGGAVIDTAGFAVTIGEVLQHSNIAGDNAIDGGLAKHGPGTLTLTGANTYTGGTVVHAGTLAVGHAEALGTGGLTVNNAAQTVLNSGLGKAVVLSSLAINGTGALDVNNNAVVVGNGDLQKLESQITTGFASGAWSGTGIRSTAAANDANGLTAIGIIKNDDTGGGTFYGPSGAFGTTFHGISILSSSDVLIKYTYYGDVNLDGVVDATDYSFVDASYQYGKTAGLSDWMNGDFNHDGLVDATDYAYIDAGFQYQGSPLASATIARHAAEFGAAYTSTLSSLTSVPEPTSLAVVGLGMGVLLRRRRHA